MRWSRSYLFTTREVPADAEVVSHQLMVRAGLIRKVAAGIYTYLPAGWRSLRKLMDIVRRELDASGAVELSMPAVQPAELWQESGRWQMYGKELLRIKDRHERDFCFGPTHEEVVTDIARRELRSYRQLPVNLYQIQTKFRDEIRPRFGLMRGREFLMKDAYSFDVDAKGAQRSYYVMFLAYLRTFQRMGLKPIPMAAATGPIGGNLSHEFIILADTGESQVFCDRDYVDMDWVGSDLDAQNDRDMQVVLEFCKSRYAATDEKHDPKQFDERVPKMRRFVSRGIEVGHIFNFGTKYSKPMGATVSTASGEIVPVEMGSYGIGVSRLPAAIIEASHDDQGIVWPEPVAPFKVGLVNLKTGEAASDKTCASLYDRFTRAGVEVLYDDTDERAGAKFSTMDLIGLPWQLIVGPRGLEKGIVEVKNRRTGAREELAPDAAFERLTA